MDGRNVLVLNGESKKLHSGQNSEGFEDRISNLPEPLIIHILSYLQTLDAVRTSVLSTKWNYLWTNVTTLRFNDCFYPTPNQRRIHKSYFMKFVEKTLLLGSPVIEIFRLSCSIDYDMSRVHSWISTVVRRNVRKIDILYTRAKPFVLPRCLCNSGSLIELRLKMPCTINVPSSICFSNLKILRLCFVTFLNVYSSHSSELQFTFPVLEELYITESGWQKVKVVNIDAPKLTIFSLYNWYDLETSFAAVKLHRSCPEQFHCGGYAFVDYILPNPSSVIDAGFDHSITDLEQRRKMCSLTFTLLRQFSSLKSLTLSCEDIKAIASIEDLQYRLPTMDNVVKLTISIETPVLDGTFIALLQSLPVLETLVMNWGTARFYGDEMVLEVVPSCLQNRLKLVKIEYFNGTDDGLELAKFLLKNAMVLEEMSITVDSYMRYRPESEFAAIKEKFLALPRGSYQASISVNTW